jgi:hypothetical protein
MDSVLALAKFYSPYRLAGVGLIADGACEMKSRPYQAGTENTAGASRRPNGGSRPPRKARLLYVVVGVTLYCAAAWGFAFAGIGAGWRALFPDPSSYASGAAASNNAEPE